MDQALEKRKQFLTGERFWLAVHQRYSCPLCKHEERNQFEQDYLGWKLTVKEIASLVGTTEGKVTAHMRAKGFWTARKLNLIEVLDQIVTAGMRDPEPRMSDAVRAIDLMADLQGLKDPETTGQKSVRLVIYSQIPTPPDVKAWGDTHKAPEDAGIVVEAVEVKALPLPAPQTNGHGPTPMPGLTL